MHNFSSRICLLLIQILCLTSAFPSYATQGETISAEETTVTKKKTQKNQSVLQRMASRCKLEGNCPEYFSGAVNNKPKNDNSEITTIENSSSLIDTTATNKKVFISPPASTQTVTKTAPSQLNAQPKKEVIATNTLTTHPFNPTNLITPFVVKESASVGVDEFPVSAIFPLPYGQYQHTDDFYVVDTNDNIIPIQTEVLNRWWGKDQSLRHIQVHFNVTIPAYELGKPSTGLNQYALYSGIKNKTPAHPITLVNKGNTITIDNTLVTLSIQKKPLKITTPSGQLTSIFTKEDGNEDFSFNHDDIDIIIEENGPLRSVIKLASQTQYHSPTDIKHGWALRLYTYANSPLVKVDFQLQNSALNTPLSAPIYFKGHKLRLETHTVESDMQIRADNLPTANIVNLPLGQYNSKQVNVMLRRFWQRFPNGLSARKNKDIDIELWPNWSHQWYDNRFVKPDLYWLDDMQHTYKEVLLDFSSRQTAKKNIAMAHTFEHPPVAVIPQLHFNQTQVTMDYSGVFPQSSKPIELKRVPHYSNQSIKTKKTTINKIGMNNFGLDLQRKHKTNGTGDWAYSAEQFFVSGNPTDYYKAQNFAKAEINIRPQWLTGYKDKQHFRSLTPSTNPYGGSSWRRFKGHSAPITTRKHIKGTNFSSKPRDDQHAWFYHIEDAYLMSGNKWIKDWYEFMAEFKKIYLTARDPFPDKSHRAEGQAISVAVAAYKYTGNQSLRPFIENYVRDYHNKRLAPPHQIKPVKGKIAGFQVGYLLRGFISIYDEFPANESILNTIKNYVEWNYSYGRFSYYKSAVSTKVVTKASGTALTLVDPVIWYSLITQQPKYAEQAINYVERGIGKGKPYGEWREWKGQFEGAMYHYYKQNMPSN